jgi:hypothetical protein
VTRQFVFLRPDVLVVFDRVESTDPSYDKRFLLHALAAPEVNGNQFTITNGEGRLIGQTLLPASADINVVTNFTVDGAPHPPSSSGNESGGTRLEISPTQEGARDYFLHVLDATDSANNAPPTATATEDEDRVTVALDHGGAHYEVAFAKTGELGGHLIKTMNGTTVCDQDLGQFASGTGGGGPGGTSGSGGPTGGPSGAGGTGGAGVDGAGDDGGCGCKAAGDAGVNGGALALLAGAIGGALLRRSKRRGKKPLRQRDTLD